MSATGNTTSAPTLIEYGSNDFLPVMPTGYLLGAFANLMMFGIFAAQVGKYFSSFSDDPRRLKFFVILVALLYALDVGLTVESFHHFFIRGKGDPDIFNKGAWSMYMTYFMLPCSSIVAQWFFVRRCYLLTGKKMWIMVVLMGSVVLTFAFGVAGMSANIAWAAYPYLTKQTHDARPIAWAAKQLPTVWLICTAAVDTAISLTLLYKLSKIRSPFEHTRHLIRRVFRLTMESILLTHLCYLIGGVLFLCSRTRTDALWFFVHVYTGAYCLSLLFSLNSRYSLRKCTNRADQQQQPFPNVDVSLTLQSPYPGTLSLPSEATSSNPGPPLTPVDRHTAWTKGGIVEEGKDELAFEEALGLGSEKQARRSFLGF